ncbi:Uncharacterised protein [Serratia marcescens]|nr:Uncharacterised protein [Serratia marcescens]CAI1155251.1 Uncharacterised protein [Serratia marcescens]CAI1923696.1 Uncharacterised protein [Serratia marcescens]CAI1985185.1 Uncharacterised protein [Serratia marcescens]
MNHCFCNKMSNILMGCLYSLFLCFLPLSVGNCGWFPEMIFTKLSPYNFVAKGVLSGVGYSQDSVSGCYYYTYLVNNQPFPNNLKGDYCGIRFEISERRQSWEGDKWQGVGNITTDTIEVLQEVLYNNNVRTIGDFLRVAMETGRMKDEVKVRTIYYDFNPNELCINASFYNKKGMSMTTIKVDGSCYRGQVIHPSCNIDGDIVIDYGLVGSNKLTDGVVSKSQEINLRCEAAATVMLRTNVINEVNFVTVNGQGDVRAKLYVNGKTLMQGDNVSISARKGDNRLTLRSDLVGTGNLFGDFFASTVLVVSMP